ncbi:protein Mis18-alpha [Amazona aestiva]|uniref:Protein yippee-like n=1 Tax=Amazona aestiva TaxID=12930 RepID=A0A0Q3PGB0_AMAAE|nr:protein Mis18-alpha [Amazona aestiva]
MVFLCAGCRRPVGDTLSWVANDEEKGCILLRRSSEKQAVTEDEPLTLESRAAMEEMLLRAETVLKVLETKMAAVESRIASLHKEV